MKKLLSILGTITLASSSTMTIVSCGNGSNPGDSGTITPDDDSSDDNESEDLGTPVNINTPLEEQDVNGSSQEEWTKIQKLYQKELDTIKPAIEDLKEQLASETDEVIKENIQTMIYTFESNYYWYEMIVNEAILVNYFYESKIPVTYLSTNKRVDLDQMVTDIQAMFDAGSFTEMNYYKIHTFYGKILFSYNNFLQSSGKLIQILEKSSPKYDEDISKWKNLNWEHLMTKRDTYTTFEEKIAKIVA